MTSPQQRLMVRRPLVKVVLVPLVNIVMYIWIHMEPNIIIAKIVPLILSIPAILLREAGIK